MRASHNLIYSMEWAGGVGSQADPSQSDAARHPRTKSQDSDQPIGHFDSTKGSNIPVFAANKADQKAGPKEKYKDRPIELVARGLLQKGASSFGERPKQGR